MAIGIELSGSRREYINSNRIQLRFNCEDGNGDADDDVESEIVLSTRPSKCIAISSSAYYIYFSRNEIPHD